MKRWGLKFLTVNQAAQSKLRQALTAAYPAAVAECRMPTLAEIIKGCVPYLEAVIQESLRCGKPMGVVFRDATCDTEVMGTPISKGTVMILSTIGPGLNFPATSIPTEHIEGKVRRQPTCGHFDDKSITKFSPERWLKVKVGAGSDQVEFDANAGPFCVFGLGPRGCFGKKLAYMHMRIFFTMIFRHFELLPAPDQFSTYAENVELVRAPKNVYAKVEKIEFFGNGKPFGDSVMHLNL